MSRCVYTMFRHIFGMPMLLSMVPLHLSGHNDKMWWNIALCTCDAKGPQCWHYMVPMALKMKFYPLGQDDSNEVQLGHVMPLALVPPSHGADDIINDTIAFLMSKWSKWAACRANSNMQYDLWGHMTPLAPVSASCDNDGIMIGTITFPRSRYSKWGATWLFGHVMLPTLALVSWDTNGVINDTITFLSSRQSNWEGTWLFDHVVPLAPALHYAHGIISGILTFLTSQ